MVNAPKKNFSPLPAGKTGNRQSAQPNDVIKRMKAERLRGRESPSPWGIAQLEIQKMACGRETTRNALLKQ